MTNSPESEARNLKPKYFTSLYSQITITRPIKKITTTHKKTQKLFPQKKTQKVQRLYLLQRKMGKA
jgi:hypothetical protein